MPRQSICELVRTLGVARREKTCILSEFGALTPPSLSQEPLRQL